MHAKFEEHWHEISNTSPFNIWYFLFLLFCWYVNRLRAQVSQNYHSESEHADTEIAALISSVILTWVLMNAVTGQQEETDSTQRPYLLVIMLRRTRGGGHWAIPRSVRPSVCPCSLGYRHAGCLQLAGHQICADCGPVWVELSSAGGAYRLAAPPPGGGDSLSAVWWIDTPVARVSWLYMRPVKSACSLINHNATSRALTEY